jgi:hypothetical protein
MFGKISRHAVHGEDVGGGDERVVLFRDFKCARMSAVDIRQKRFISVLIYFVGRAGLYHVHVERLVARCFGAYDTLARILNFVSCC